MEPQKVGILILKNICVNEIPPTIDKVLEGLIFMWDEISVIPKRILILKEQE